MTASIREIVHDYNQAFGDSDFERLESLLHPDLVFGGAAKETHGAAEYLAGLRRLAPAVIRNEVKTILVEGNQAFVLYDFVTDTPAGAVLSGELLTIDDGLISSITLLYDMRRWPEFLQSLAGRVEAAPAAVNS
jgi:ketosteroid isomerase-like protein